MKLTRALFPAAIAICILDAATAGNVSSRLLPRCEAESMPGFGPELAIDGSLKTPWRAESLNANLELLASRPFRVSGVELVFPDAPGERPKEFSILARRNGIYERIGGGEAKDKVFKLDLPAPVEADAIKFATLKASSYATGISEFKVFSEEDIPQIQGERDIASLARVYSSFRRCLHPGDPLPEVLDDGSTKAVDGNPASVWKIGPYAQLFLLFGSPVHVSRVKIDFGSREGRCSAYELQAMQGGLWTRIAGIEGNDDAVREHKFNVPVLAEGVRLIPLKTAQLSATNVASFEVYSRDVPAACSSAPAPAARSFVGGDLQQRRPFGIYAVDHWRDFFPLPEGIFADGVEYYALWQEIEPKEGVFKWETIDDVLDVSFRHKQRVVLKFLSDIYCPAWIFKNHGVAKILPDDSKAYNPPAFWNAAYLNLLSKAVHELGRRYDGDPAIDSVIMTFAGTGEMGRFGQHPHSVWEKAGYTDEVFAETCKQIVDIYCDSFKRTPLTAQLSYIGSNGSATPALLVAEYAAGKGVAIEQAAFDDSMGYPGGKSPSVKGRVSFIDIYRNLRGRTHLSAEANAGFCYNLGSRYPERFQEVLWQYLLNCLGLGVDHISVYPPDLLRPDAREIVEFARRRLGKTPADTPSAWMSLRGEPLANPSIGVSMKDGDRSVASKDLVSKRFCRSTNIASGVGSIDFKLDQAFSSRFKDGFKVRIIYLDSGEDSWKLLYKGTDGRVQEAQLFDKFGIEPLQSSGVVRKNGSGLWKQALFFIPGTLGECSIDACSDGDESIHFIEFAPRDARLEAVLYTAGAN